MINVDDKFLKQIPFAEGGEGTIYEYGADRIIKVYKPHIDISKKQLKINLLMSKSLPKTVVKPIDLVYKNGKFIGYVMNKVSGEEVRRLSNKKHIKLNGIKYRDILKVLVEIKNTLLTLHSQNIYVGDLNDCNILYDNNYNVFFIDCDSWSIDTEKCDVCMDSFKDPLLSGNDFSSKTDAFAYAVLIFKSLTKIHPFGGVTKPDMDIIQRMQKGISVVDNTSVIIPKTISGWNYIPPKLLGEMKEIFQNTKRYLIDATIDDFYGNLKLCSKDGEHYYSKFNECPFCNGMAKVLEKPQKVAVGVGDLIPVLYFSKDDVQIIISTDVYVDVNGMVVHKQSGRKEKRTNNSRYYFSNDGSLMYEVTNRHIKVCSGYGEYEFEKTNRSMVDIINDKCFYVNPNNNLVELSVTKGGNSTRTIAKCAFNNLFRFYDESNYVVCNIYDGMKIFNVSGYNYTIKNDSKIINYGLHYDDVRSCWLFVIEDKHGKFDTYVFNKNKLVYQSDTIKYTADLSNICMNNGVVFTPHSGLIRGFAYEKNIYKDFLCSAVDEDSRLSKNGRRFTIVNEKEIYTFG